MSHNKVDPEKVEKRPHYSDKRTWWAIILVAALSGLGGGLAKEITISVRNSMTTPPHEKIEERELVITVTGERDEPVRATVLFIPGTSGGTVSQITTDHLGIARLKFESAHAVGHYVLTVERGNQTFSKRGELEIGSKRTYSQVHTFDPEDWFPGDLLSVLGRASNNSSSRDRVTASRTRRDPAEVPWMSIALDEIGVQEIRGSEHDPRVMEYWSSLPSWKGKATDEDDWSSAFVAWVLKSAGVEAIDSAINRDWLAWGDSTEAVEGCVAVFWRESPTSWKGHAGFLVDEDERSYHVLGGNQRNSVSIERIPKARFLGCRWPSE